MTAIGIFTLYNQLSTYAFERISDDDRWDRLSRRYSAITMVIFALIISTYTFVGQPIRCWCPVEYSDTRCEYATTYCYITSQYVPILNGTVLPTRNEIMSRRIYYYQWVVYIFLVQALFLYAPCILWRCLSRKQLFDITEYVDLLDSKKDNKTIEYIAKHIVDSIQFTKTQPHRGLFSNLRPIRCLIKKFDCLTLIISNLIVKLTYFVSIFVQIFLLEYWINDGKSNKYSIFYLYNWNNLRERFPRMTLCKFSVFTLTEEQPHWLQCALPINNYLEKFYYFILLGLWILLLFTLLGFLYTSSLLFKFRRKIFIKNKVLTNDYENDDFHDLVENPDGCLVIYLLSENISGYYTKQITMEVINKMKSKKSSAPKFPSKFDEQ